MLGDGTLLATADHVLGPAKSARIRTKDGRIFDATIIVREPLTDIALLKVEEKLQAFETRAKPSTGNKSCAIGNSFGLDISVTCGVVSATKVSGIGFNQIEDFVQTDAAVNPGMSGGALIDDEGNLIGLLSAIFTKGSDANLGVNFAVSSDLLFTIIDDYQQDETISLRRAGILARPGEPNETGGQIGIEVVRILPGTSEKASDLKIGDIIVQAGERRIKNLAAYRAAIALADSEDDMRLLLWRDANELTINLKP